MSPEERQLLEETVALSRDNNKMLRQLRGAMRWAWFYSIIKWAIVIATTLGAYYYLQPYLFKLLDAYKAVLDGVDQVKEAGAAIDVQNFIMPR